MQYILNDVMLELNRATQLHRSMTSAHEAYAVILEELDEVWDEVKAKEINAVHLRKELIHVAAMAVRAIHDLEL